MVIMLPPPPENRIEYWLFYFCDKKSFVAVSIYIFLFVCSTFVHSDTRLVWFCGFSSTMVVCHEPDRVLLVHCIALCICYDDLTHVNVHAKIKSCKSTISLHWCHHNGFRFFSCFFFCAWYTFVSRWMEHVNAQPNNKIKVYTYKFHFIYQFQLLFRNDDSYTSTLCIRVHVTVGGEPFHV